MVARITTGKTMRGALSYNENKVRQGTAVCIAASSFGANTQTLSFADKIARFQKRIQLNDKTKTNVVHISLNFDPSEKLAAPALEAIANAYMHKIGFGDQPFLVYQHRDAAHPHIHILSTNITRQGQRINLHNLGRVQSEDARKKIEIDFNLVKAQSHHQRSHQPRPVDISKMTYGKSETRKTITDIVRHVTGKYRYTSLQELNAALRQFNVIADKGQEGTTMLAKGGLIYAALDHNGNKVGVPLKASALNGKPTLRFLQKQFLLGRALREPLREKTRKKIDTVLAKPEIRTLQAFVASLAKSNVYTLPRQNHDGRIYGITFVDNENRVVFNGSDLGKAYSAGSLTARLSGQPAPDERPLIATTSRSTVPESEPPDLGFAQLARDLMLASQTDFSTYPAPAKRRKRKKKRKL